jgi:excinuclease ABC subunit A
MTRGPRKQSDAAVSTAARDCISIRGARQANLQNLDVDLPLGELIVVTGVSGSGKSSLAFDTVYAEGQRRYVETFSPYARQFLDRMDRPKVDRIDGIPPAIAIDQSNQVRTSRSTVGTMTEVADHLKLLYARAASLWCGSCGGAVRRDRPETIVDDIAARLPSGQRLLVTFPVTVPENFAVAEVKTLLAQQGYTRIHAEEERRLEVIQDRVRLGATERGRLLESVERALAAGRGRVTLRDAGDTGDAALALPYSSDLHCARCDVHYADPTPGHFSFNSPVGACEACRGFGRVIGIDYGLVVPDASRSLAAGAIKPFQSASYRECQTDLLRFAKRAGVPVNQPWSELTEAQRRWVIDGEGPMADGVWYGIGRFFGWLESRAYKMHVRVLLSRYRSYTRCPDCHGARLKRESLLWRLGEERPRPAHFRPPGIGCSEDAYAALPGLHLHEVMLLPLQDAARWFADLELPAPLAEATNLLLGEIRSRLQYLLEVGLGYLTLDRQSRTLSGGEVQRINLTTALGTSLVNTLFVLDEPSVGLHARDIDRIVGVLHRLRDAGNSLLVVEHDPQVMRAADRILDMGPGAGTRGGRISAFAPPAAIAADRNSLTGDYLAGRRRVSDADRHRRAPDRDTFWLELRGASANNLRGIDVRIPLQRLVCITGVSGSGKSTLIEEVLYPALRRLKVPGAETADIAVEVLGHEHVNEVVLVDQSPLGRTTRANPASHVGIMTGIREAFAALAVAQLRGYTAGTFSFNSGDGRCPACGGNGFEHVEMQFLSDVYLRCPDCDGRRFRPEILEVRLPGAGGIAARSVAEVLDLTVNEALAFFADRPAVLPGLHALAAVGLDYLALGQPVTTLSGGEAQRLKLAGQLARTTGARNLLLLDEPTTGLHLADVATLLAAFRALLDEGHSIIVIEHHLDLIRAADWLIDLGPEAGAAGGQIVAAGPPEAVAAVAASHTGRALKAAASRPTRRRAVAPSQSTPPPQKRHRPQSIEVCHAREHNLRDLSVSLPLGKMSVITGVSGSGKSTLAFDVLFAEGQRRYLESLNAYARQFVQPAARPDVESVNSIPPTVAIEQRTSRGGQKSTVATQTEIYHFLRLIYARLGTQFCPDCDTRIEPQNPDSIVARVLREARGQTVQLLAPLVIARKGLYTELARWAARRGHDELRVDGELLPTSRWPRLDRYIEHDIELPLGDVVAEPGNEARLRALMHEALEIGKGSVQVRSPKGTTLYSIRRACPGCGRSFPELDPRLFSFNSRHGWCPTCFGTGLELEDFDAEQSGEEAVWLDTESPRATCGSCCGQRLRPEALGVRFRDRSIANLTALPVDDASRLFDELALTPREAAIAHDALGEIRGRLHFLREVGLGYLALDRAAPTISGGEAQRIRLAAQLGSNLRGVCYVLDEPTIGLHPRDNARLLTTLTRLRDQGNTVLVVEHDEDTIRQADHVLDLGPGAGRQGGRVVAAGTPAALLAAPESVTGRCLARLRIAPSAPSRPPTDGWLRVHDADRNNLRKVDAAFPLGQLTTVSGVSGSGKSTLVRQVLLPSLRRAIEDRRRAKPVGCSGVSGHDSLERVLEVDQTPIGKSPRSCPATYTGIWDEIRRLYARTTDAGIRGFAANRFSFNVPGGRCPACEGQGMQRVEMSFLPDVHVPCDACGGRRFNAETLEVRYRERTISEVLAMSVGEAAALFAAHGKLAATLQLMVEVGLDYLTLGQQSPTLSGGEAQRLKLVAELARARPGTSRGLYILDEPTVGLHMADVERLLAVLQRLVAAGNTVIVIEHNLDVIAASDWVIDLGPEGGRGGGEVVAAGSPAELIGNPRSHTAAALRAQFGSGEPVKAARKRRR